MAVAILGIIVVVLPAALHIGQVLGEDPFEVRTRTVTVVREVDGKPETETTTSPSGQSALDLALSSGGLLLLRLGIVALASFLAGATVQRIIAMDFAGKLGPLELRSLSRASSATIEDVARDLERYLNLIRATQTLAARTARRVAESDARLHGLESRIAGDPSPDQPLQSGP